MDVSLISSLQLRKVSDVKASCVQFLLYPLEVCFVGISKSRCSSTGWGFVMNSLPHNNIVLASCDWSAHLKNEFSPESFSKERQDFSALSVIRKVGGSLSPMESGTTFDTRMNLVIYDNNVGWLSLGETFKGALIEREDLPCHRSWRHFAHDFAVSGTADSAFHVGLVFLTVQLVLKAFPCGRSACLCSVGDAL